MQGFMGRLRNHQAWYLGGRIINRAYVGLYDALWCACGTGPFACVHLSMQLCTCV